MADDPEVLLVTPRFRVLRHQQMGRDGKLHPRDVVQHPGAVTILPLLADQKVCLIRNLRIAVGETLVELPAGTLEPGENPLVAARRELAEETGYQAGKLEKLCEFFMSPGILNERMHLYLATELTAGRQALEVGETIENHLVDYEQALSMTLGGEIRDAKTLVGLLYYESWRQRNRAS